MKEGSYCPTIPEVGTRLRENGQLHVPLGNNTRYLLHRKLGVPQSWSASYGVEKKILSLPGIELRFIDCPSRSLI
jgi:hypothetical protein